MTMYYYVPYWYLWALFVCIRVWKDLRTGKEERLMFSPLFLQKYKYTKLMLKYTHGNTWENGYWSDYLFAKRERERFTLLFTWKEIKYIETCTRTESWISNKSTYMFALGSKIYFFCHIDRLREDKHTQNSKTYKQNKNASQIRKAIILSIHTELPLRQAYCLFMLNCFTLHSKWRGGLTKSLLICVFISGDIKNRILRG